MQHYYLFVFKFIIIYYFSKNWFSTDRIIFTEWNPDISDQMKMWRIKQKRSLLYASQKSPSRRKSKSRKFTLNTGTCMAWEDISLEAGQLMIVKIKIWPDPPCFHFGRNIAQNFADDHMLVLKSSYNIHFFWKYSSLKISLHCMITLYLFLNCLADP